MPVSNNVYLLWHNKILNCSEFLQNQALDKMDLSDNCVFLLVKESNALGLVTCLSSLQIVSCFRPW